MKLLCSLLIAGGVLLAQGPDVTISPLPALNPGEILYGYSGSNNIYICYSRTFWPTSGPASISAATNANPVVFTSTAHGFYASIRPQITISGGTGNWTAINGSFVATIIDANTFSIPVNSTAFGALTGTITYTTTAPRTNQKQWAVRLQTFDGSGNILSVAWLNGASSIGSSKCSDAVSTTINAQ